MKVEGKVQNINLLVLIDSGASHNFISPKVTTALGLTITPTTARSIKLGDGHKVNTDGVCKDINMKLGEVDITFDALVLDLGGMDMVLGVAWLSTLGRVIMDWKAMTMQFSHKGHMVKLQGLGNKLVRQSFFDSYLEDSHCVNELNHRCSKLQSLETNDLEIHEDLKSILDEFQEVFKDTIQLPPERSQVHHINLYPDHGVINARPYRYPHHQKEEIEKQSV
jgi:hypothetical protein